MTPTHSRSRQQAEIAFADAQSQFRAREQPAEKLDASAQSRAEKTLRLKAAREARDQTQQATTAVAPGSKRVPKP